MKKKATKATKKKPPRVPSPPSKNWRRVTRQQLAELMGAHPDSVTDWSRAGMPVITRGGHGKNSAYDAVACLKWQRQQLGKNAKDTAQTRAFNAQAELNELKLEEQRAGLVSRETVVRDGQAYTTAWVAQVRALPRRFAQAGLLTRDQEPAAAQLCRDVVREIHSWKTIADTEVATQRADAPG